jgi:succinate dehydrogenase / fumarate reductase membrane anchor subunit
MLLFIINSVYHMWLGMQMVVEDYVHDDLRKLITLMANTFFSIAVAFVAIYAILKLSFGV